MYEKSFGLVDVLYVLMIYQHNEPFKIIGVFNYYNGLSLASSSSETQGQIVGTRKSLNGRKNIWHEEK